MWHSLLLNGPKQVSSSTRPEVDQGEFIKAMENGALEDLFVALARATGDTFLCCGNTHTIGSGMVLCEIRSNSA